MKYEIQREFDLEKGLMLRVQFPEEDIDKKALYTIQNDMPDFLIPFKCRSIDGMMQCTYYVGTDTKLQNHLGICDKEAYIQCWKRILSPILECKDWFLNPYSFVFDISQLYTDKNESYVRYLYIPAKTPASDFSQLNSMVADISRENTVEDTAMENIVLRSIMQNFSPKEFLNLLDGFDSKSNDSKEERQEESNSSVKLGNDGGYIKNEPVKKERKNPFSGISISKPRVEPRIDPVIQVQQEKKIEPMSQPEPEPRWDGVNQDPMDEIHIDFGEENKSIEKKNKKVKEKPVKEKKVKEKSSKGSFMSRLGFGKKKQQTSGQMLGAPADFEPEQENREIYEPAYDYDPTYDEDQDESVTQLIGQESTGPYLQYVGNQPNMPRRIEIVILQNAGRFTIGRFDITVGRQQSDFEFPKNTMGVSRKHAIIERFGDTYSIVDRDSTAGTYVNGTKLLANQTAQLTDNCRVSFGYDGADYIWRER